MRIKEINRKKTDQKKLVVRECLINLLNQINGVAEPETKAQLLESTKKTPIIVIKYKANDEKKSGDSIKFLSLRT